MASIAKNALPSPHLVTHQDETAMLISQQTQLPFQHLPDPDINPRLFRASWLQVPGSVADAIRRHYAEHLDEVFLITIPRTAEVVNVMWRSHPTIQWASGQFAGDVAGAVEEVLAYD